ncbi:hypothetical protein I79_015890 [Cricetulus griseus]|uniref:Uncharacterized protein n=1 Tax=Cricetulus griseus TaxID=10029 RepID=G3HXX4_CRIGR|nr:hypothetical protein I79_015890 [Cricetulus griseus]
MHIPSNRHIRVCPRRRSLETKANIWHRNEALAFGASIGAKKWNGPPVYIHTHTGAKSGMVHLYTLTNRHKLKLE